MSCPNILISVNVLIIVEVIRASDTWRATIFGSVEGWSLEDGGGDGGNEGEYFLGQWKGGAWRMEGGDGGNEAIVWVYQWEYWQYMTYTPVAIFSSNHLVPIHCTPLSLFLTRIVHCADSLGTPLISPHFSGWLHPPPLSRMNRPPLIRPP